MKTPNQLIADLPRGRGPKDIGVPAQAYFEPPENIAATASLRFNPDGNPEGKLFLGVLGGEVVTGKPLPDGRPNRWVQSGSPIGVGDDRHVCLFASGRSGKGRGPLMINLIAANAATPLLVLDVKSGELARATARWRAEGMGQQTGVLDPFDCSGERTRPYRVKVNALSILQRSDRTNFVPNCKLIADSIIVTGDFKEKHWDETAKQILGGLIGHVATHVNYANIRDLVTVWRLAAELATPDGSGQHRSWLEREMLENDAASGMIRFAARNFYNRTGGEFSSVLSNLTKHLDWIAIECMQEVLRESV